MGESNPFEKKRSLLRTVGIPLAAIVLLIGGWEGFHVARLQTALTRARREIDGRQFMRANFWAERALTLDPGNTDAMRLMAEIEEAQDHTAAVGWRMKVAAHGKPADIMAWAKCAMRFGQAEMAMKALETLPQDFKDHTAEYHELLAGFALANHQAAEAEGQFIKAAQLDPGDPVNEVNLAAFRVDNAASPEARDAAARDLEAALTDSRVSLLAVRALLAHAIHTGDHAGAARYAAMLLAMRDHTFTDELACLDTTTGQPGFHAALEKVEGIAAADAQSVAETGDWLTAHGMAPQALEWIGHLPASTQSSVQVEMSAAQSRLTLRDWAGLAAYLAKCKWGSGDFLRRAMMVRCKRELGQPWEADWKQLVADVEANPPNNLLLAHVTIGWQWRDETLGLLWGAADKPGTGSQALQYLWELYAQTKDTRELQRVASRQVDLDPNNAGKENNAALLSLLMYGGSAHSQRLAQDAAEARPDIPEWQATYAYALHLSGSDTEALRVLKRIPPDGLKHPDVALFYAIVLAANGDAAHARGALGQLNEEGLLPEQQKLATDLAQRLGR